MIKTPTALGGDVADPTQMWQLPSIRRLGGGDISGGCRGGGDSQ